MTLFLPIITSLAGPEHPPVSHTGPTVTSKGTKTLLQHHQQFQNPQHILTVHIYLLFMNPIV